MIPGFIAETTPLLDYEIKTVLPRILSGFHSIAKTGDVITNKKIVAKLQAQGMDVSEARIRKIINHIRTHDLVIGLCASSDGYWVERDPRKFLKYIHSVKDRIDSIQNMHNKLLNQYKKMLNHDQTECDFKDDPVPNIQGFLALASPG